VRDEAVPPACDAKGKIENQNLLTTSLPTARIRIQSSEVGSKKEKTKQLRNQRSRPGRRVASRHDAQPPKARHGMTAPRITAAPPGSAATRARLRPPSWLCTCTLGSACRLAPRPSRTGSRRP
jgi:hypothetical protein